VDDLSRLVVIEDDRAAIRVELGNSVPPLLVGDKVQVSGITAAGDVRPQVLGGDLKVLDTGVQLPPPQPLSAAGIRSGALDYRRVGVAGVQRGRWLNRAGRVVVEVETPAGLVQATSFASSQDIAPRWLGRHVRFAGVLCIARDATGGGLRPEIWLDEWQRIELDEATGAVPIPATGLPLLRTVGEIRRLGSAETPKGYPVLLQGIVTEPYRPGPNIFLQDSTGGIFARDLPEGLTLRAGDRIELKGHTLGGSFLTDVEAEQVRITGYGPMPVPAKASLRDLLAGRHRAEWVAIEGVVQSVQPGSGEMAKRLPKSVALELVAEGARILVSLRYPSGGLPLQWVAARIRALGVCGSQFNQRHQFLGIRLNVPGPEFISVLEPAPTTLPPLRHVAELLRPLPGETPDLRVRVRGIVILPLVPDLGGFYLQDDTGGVFVRARPGETLAVGDEVEAAGFPELGRMLPVVEATGYGKTGRTSAVAPVAVLAEEAMRGDYDSQLIRIRGSLSTHVVGPRHEEFTLQSGNTVFRASLDRLSMAQAINTIRPGSLVEVTGVCVANSDRNRVPESFRVLLRSPQDVVTIEQAPWWNRQRALGGLGLLAVVAISVFAWVLLLRRRVREQTTSIAIEKERYRSLVDHAPDIVFGSDLKGDLTSVNPAAELLLGYSEAELVGRNIWDLLPTAQQEAAREHARRMIAGESSGPLECNLPIKGGGTLVVEVNASVVRKDGRPVAVLGILRDVTERQRLEEQLRQAQKMEAIGRLAGGVAHDFNNLLTVINGYSDMFLKELAGDDPQRPAVEEIRGAGERAAALTKQLLAFGRRQISRPRALDLNALISEAKRMLQRLIGEDILIETDLDPSVALVEADPSQMNQVMLNLSVNARDAMPNGGRLVLSTANALFDTETAPAGCQPGAYVKLTVADTGTGMDDETMRHLFEPFFTTKPTGLGTGLGLATVYGIVKQSGGWICPHSELGKGCRFEIYLPRAGGPAESVSPADAESPHRQPQNLTIMVVEDQDGVRHLASHALRGCGYTVLDAANGEEALRLAQSIQDGCHLVVTDVVMPGMSGKALAEELRERWPEVKVLYMSGYPNEVILRHGLMNGEVHYLGKPFTPSELTAKVREVMG
jgi:PAS domain S-box-containing protein